MDTSSQLSEQEAWVKVNEHLDHTFSFTQPLLAEKTWMERSVFIVAAWSLLLYRGSACCNDDETFAIGFKSVDQDISYSELRTFSISQLVKCKNDPIHKVLQAAETVIDQLVHGEYENQEVVALCASNNGADEEIKIDLTADSLGIKIQRKPTLLAANMTNVYIHAFAKIMQSLLSSEDATVKDAIEIGDHELDQIWSWNKCVPQKIDRCVQELFSQEATKRPGEVAVVSWDGQLTYAEVDRLSTALAFRLIKAGVQVGDVVPLCFEKSMWTIVGVLGVLKAGAGVALTDPSQPEARLSIIAEEVGAKVVVTSLAQGALGEKISPTGKVITVGPTLSDDIDNTESQSELPTAPSDTILYIIFTSGSTGKPKGVIITHANYLSGAIPRAEKVGYSDHSRVLDFPSYAFDVSVDLVLSEE
ncbi:hypothetical protein KEM56_000525 [Ascosphaera pollenicola]|nr:hypothetical protein KEM56_000525 [Ascosphaera pollenicola]